MGRRFRRALVSGLLAVAMLATMCAGFGAALAEEKVKISFWKSPHSDHEEEIWAAINDQFNKEYPNIEVEFLAVPWDSVNQKELAAFAAGSPPDVSFQVEQYLSYAQSGKLVDVGKLMTPEKLAGYPQGALDYCTYDGKLMGVPFVALNSVMFYNKDLFAAEGVEPPKTWDELVTVGQKLTKDTDSDGTVDQYGMLFPTKPTMDQWIGVTFIEQAGGDLWNADITNIGFNNEAGTKGLQFIADLFNNYKIVPPIDTFSSTEEEKAAFYNGKIAMYPAQIQIGANIRTANPNLNLGAFLMPKGPAADDTHANWSFSNMGMLSIASDSKHQEEAWKFVEFITRPEIESQYLSQVGFFSPQVATNDLMYQGDEIMTAAKEGIKDMQTSPASPNFEAMFSGLATLFETVVREAASPADAIAELEQTMSLASN